MFIILQELMHRTFVETEGRAPRRHEIPKPCDHFDLIVGTGTGGLIAIMLGRLRLDLETCKQLYVRLTRMVFETDKTIAGIPYRSTLFKASKLEEAIKLCVREHTIFEKEGNDGGREPDANLVNPLSSGPRRHQSNASVVSFSARSPAAQMAATSLSGNARYGDPNARLYDSRENRTKTAVTAMYKGSPRNSAPVLLRSYDSRKEPPPEFDCKIWQAGRATCAIGLAFKPVQIGQSMFHDDGVGTFNPSPEALDEAVINEWPGRDIGVFVSVGTGKRPKGSDSNSQQWYEGFLGEFAEARRRLISKIEGCESIHEYMVREHLSKRNVNVENYFRLNVEVGVGEFGMNEWHRLGDISTSTRRYMGRPDEQKMIHGISTRLAKILKAKIRWERAQSGYPSGLTSGVPSGIPGIKYHDDTHLDAHPLAVELPGDSPLSTSPMMNAQSSPSRASFESGQDTLAAGVKLPNSPRSSQDFRPERREADGSSPPPGWRPPPPRKDSDLDFSDKLVVSAPTPSQYQTASGADKIAIMSPDENPRPQPLFHGAPHPQRIEPPPLPPKTPLPEHQKGMRQPPMGAAPPPYPLDDDEEPPPAVNMARKPEFRGR
jgi:hypothetical protein